MKKKVFVSGCYDLLHSGHVEFFQQASRYGDLYVGIGSDATYLEYKHRKPMFPQEERLFMVKNIKAVKDAYINEGKSPLARMAVPIIIYYLCIRNQNSLIMETREYFEKVMQDYNQNRKGRSLRKYCKDEAVDYDWLIEFKKSYRSNKLQPDENKKLGEGEFIALTVEENFVPEQQTPAGWQVERLILKSPTGDEMEIKCTNLFAVAELLRKMS